MPVEPKASKRIHVLECINHISIKSQLDFSLVLHKANTSIESKPRIRLIACTKTFRECISLVHYYLNYLFPSK